MAWSTIMAQLANTAHLYRTCVCVVLALTGWLLVLACGATLASGRLSSERVDVPRSVPQVELALGKRGKYEVAVTANHRQVVLTVYRGLSLTSYVAKGHVSGHSIRAKFGDLGGMAVHFKSSGKTKRDSPPPGCKGKPSIKYLGTYVGRISFTGEHGYVDLSARRARGTWRAAVKWNCKRKRASEASKDDRLRRGVSAFAVSTPGRGTFFAALRREEEASFSSFLVGIREQRGSLRIERVGIAIGDPYDYDFNESHTVAIVDPPFPFNGTAAFNREIDGSASWTGTLSVLLPGTKKVPLTGSSFTPRLVELIDIKRIVDLLESF